MPTAQDGEVHKRSVRTPHPNSPGSVGNNISAEEAEPVLLKAIELGCTFWDTAVSEWIVFQYSNARGG